jgi:hypothetical protein
MSSAKVSDEQRKGFVLGQRKKSPASGSTRLRRARIKKNPPGK